MSLMGLYQHQAGSIQVEGKSAAEHTLTGLRNIISYVPQETFLFNGTVIENIAIGKVGATELEIIDASKCAYAHDFIVALPMGYNTNIGERGIKLSGGQKQRIAIARAVLKKSPVLLLDEATASMDSESETQVHKAIQNLMMGKTTLVIAHRLDTIEKAETIIVIDEGKVAEIGTHKQLKEVKGIYAKLKKFICFSPNFPETE